MKTKLLLKIAATLGAFVLVGGISVAALARSGAGSSTAPRLPVVSTPEPTETESPQADDSQDSNHDSQDSNDDSNHDSEDSNDDSSHDSEDSNDDSHDQGENNDDQGENEAEDD
jgi:hypothetical protein